MVYLNRYNTKNIQTLYQLINVKKYFIQFRNDYEYSSDFFI